MTTTKTPLSTLATSRCWQSNFLGVLPAVQNHARHCFRRLHGEARQEAIAATIAQAFADYGNLARQRKLAHVYPSSLASFAVQRVRAGRPVGTPQNTRDLFNRDPLRIQSLTPCDSGERTWRELVIEDRRVTPAEQACFNLDFRDWLSQWPRRHRKIITTLAAGNRTHEVAAVFKLSCARISRLRREFQRSWEQFQGVGQAA